MHGFSADTFKCLEADQLHAPLPPAWVAHQLSVVMLVRDLPSANEVKRAGKRIASLKTRWSSFSRLGELKDPFVVQRFPGTRAQAIVASCPQWPPAFKTFASLLETPLGSWHDLQVFDRGMLVAFTVREEDSLWIASRPSRVSLDDAYGERLPLPAGLPELLHQ